jgi:RNA polymerase sigma factor (sigma-70 family)
MRGAGDTDEPLDVALPKTGRACAMRSNDPLENPAHLIRRVYAYVAYRIGDGPDAEDVTSSIFERALRYRASYDPLRGAPLTWLLGIARRCIDDLGQRTLPVSEFVAKEDAAPGHLESEALERLALSAAFRRLDERSRDLLALRYGADLSARQIGDVLGMRTNTVEVALHRVLRRLRADLESEVEPLNVHVADSPSAS